MQFLVRWGAQYDQVRKIENQWEDEDTQEK